MRPRAAKRGRQGRIRHRSRDVGDVDHLLCPHDAVERGSRRARPNEPRRCRRDSANALAAASCMATDAEASPSQRNSTAELGLADARRVLQHGLEHRLQIAGRAGDDLEHLGGRGLLLQRLGKIVGALAQLVEQPRVLDGDDGLGGEVLHQLDLLVGEWLDLLAVDDDRADELIVL